MEICHNSSMTFILSIVKRILLLIQIIVPIILIIFSVISFINIINSPEEKNGIKKIIQKFLAAAIVFFIPLIIDVIMNILGNNTSFSSCWLQAEDQLSVSTEYYYDENAEEKKQIMADPSEYEPGVNTQGIAELALRVAPYASPDPTTVFGPRNLSIGSISAKCGSTYTPNPWYPPSQVDPRYKEYEKIMDAVMNSSRPGNKAYGSCAQAVAGIVRATVDPDFETSNPEGQIEYLRNNTEKWDLVYTTKPGEKFSDVCQPGDVLVTETGWTHSMIYLGTDLVKTKFPNSDGMIFQAGYSECDHAKYPRIDAMTATPVPFNIYRPTGRGTFKYPFIDVEQVLNGS